MGNGHCRGRSPALFFWNSRRRRIQIYLDVYTFPSFPPSQLFLVLPPEFPWTHSEFLSHPCQHAASGQRLHAGCHCTECPHSSPSPIYHSRGSADPPLQVAATDASVSILYRSHGTLLRASLATLSRWVHSRSRSGREFVSRSAPPSAPLPQLDAGTSH